MSDWPNVYSVCDKCGAISHSDHAAELAEWKQRAERAEAYVAGQDVRSDFRNAGEMRAALDVALRENTLLRAECDAKQKKIDDARDTFIHIAEYWNGSDNDRAVADALEVMRNAATDAAKALGAEMPARKLPQAEDFAGGGRVDITGGIDSAEYVRGMRDGAKGAGT